MNRPIALIPFYNHPDAILSVVDQLRQHELPVLIVDDGSDAASRTVLDTFSTSPHVQVHRKPKNGGKGSAVKVGFELADSMGYTHVLQVDADGQHHLADVPAFLALSEAHPDTVICGQPVYGHDIPAARLHGRKLTRFWVNLQTLSHAIPDALCGFRLYPLEAVRFVRQTPYMGNWMDFDPEILIHLYWRDTPLRWIPTRVSYATDGVSHYRMVRDNLLMSRMHARSCLHMLPYLPSLLRRALKRDGT
ncbi:glycosyl transferase [Advenella kashmirensis W13003]|uniref:Glycosyl transferase n=1 Tax=Advenella kashmirensis W13003 TaxID=1424334 RepID=V8QX43_9BURK|nr:glycosyltransferase family 2 protein [Advenella kashmirensis]ETF03564.1 glycosyl transferase [Advenella kashmirensis W13003]